MVFKIDMGDAPLRQCVHAYVCINELSPVTTEEGVWWLGRSQG